MKLLLIAARVARTNRMATLTPEQESKIWNEVEAEYEHAEFEDDHDVSDLISEFFRNSDLEGKSEEDVADELRDYLDGYST